MNRLYFSLILVSKLIFAQDNNTKIIYLDSLEFPTTKENHKSYIVIEDYNYSKAKYKISEYFPSGKIKKSGFSTGKDNFIEDGEIYNYFESGSIKSIINYKDGYENGNCIYWHENSSKKLEGNYTLKRDNDNVEVLLKVDNFWNEKNIQTVINGEGEMIDSGEFNYFDKNISSKGKIKNGLKDGEWVGFDSDYSFTFNELYENGKLISGTSKDVNNNTFNYTEIITPPRLNGGMATFYKYIQNNFKQPENIRKQEKVITKFVINTDGNIVELVTVKSVRKDVDAEAIRLLSNFKGFYPKVYRGIKTKTTYQIPIVVHSIE